VIGVKS